MFEWKLQYKLNDVHENEDGTVTIGLRVICKSAYDYINKYESLEQAYKRCRKPDYLNYLIHMLHITHTLEEYRFFKTREYLLENKKFNDAKLGAKWVRDWVRIIKEVYPWSRMKDILLREGLIIEK